MVYLNSSSYNKLLILLIIIYSKWFIWTFGSYTQLLTFPPNIGKTNLSIDNQPIGL